MSAPAVIVSGMIARTPGQGGAAWAVLQYLLGLRRLGCDVVFVEPVGPRDELPAEVPRYLETALRQSGVDVPWALVPEDGGDPVGMSRAQLRDAAVRSDVLLSVSGMLTDEDVLEAVPLRAYLDLDPVFNQLWHAAEGVDMRFDAHTHFVSLSDVVGADGSPIPDCGRTWLPTVPPVVLDAWPVADTVRHDALTTVGHWRSYGSVHVDGVQYGQKAHALRALIDLPRRTRARFALALGIHPDETADLAALREHGWELLDPAALTSRPDDYRRFVQGSWAEFGLAKSGYALAGSGWFSDRSACYLASGRPVLAQRTGFERRLPVGEGLLAFDDAASAAAGAEALLGDYERHRRAARELAEEHLDSDRVLGSLLERLCR